MYMLCICIMYMYNTYIYIYIYIIGVVGEVPGAAGDGLGGHHERLAEAF